jgi:N-acetylglutamate synthase-like GNAT family acetyltransferase
MAKKIRLDGSDYDIEKLNNTAKNSINSVIFIDQRISELNNMQALLQRAKNSYLETIKKEVIADKAGFLLEDN